MNKNFHTANRWDLEWQDDVDVLTLRNGVQVKVLYEDADAGHTDMLIKFRGLHRARAQPRVEPFGDRARG